MSRISSIHVRLMLGLVALVWSAAYGDVGAIKSSADHWLIITGEGLTAGVDNDLRLSVYDEPGNPIWQTSKSAKPGLMRIHITTPEQKEQWLTVPLGEAAERTVEEFDDGSHEGHRIRLTDLPGTDAVVELVLALSDDGELLVRVEQVGGGDIVQRVANLYDWSIKPRADAYMVVPHGSGQLIHSNSPKHIWTAGFVGGPFTLPVFGIVRGDKTLYPGFPR